MLLSCSAAFRRCRANETLHNLGPPKDTMDSFGDLFCADALYCNEHNKAVAVSKGH